MEFLKRFEQKERLEYGANVAMEIELIRHPDKDYETGNITNKGKQQFLEKLENEYDDSFDLVKFYLSPHKRPQQLRKDIQNFLKEKRIKSSIRTKEELLGRWSEFSPQAKKALIEELKKRNILTQDDLDKITKEKKQIAYEPETIDLEQVGNSLLIEQFFDKKWPDSHLKGKDFGQEIEKLIDHFSKLASRLKSNSRVKIVLIGHSGVIEYFNKLIYLKNHPELQPEEVNLKMIGGLIKPLEGPKIEIRSDENGKQTIKLFFKGKELIIKKQ